MTIPTTPAADAHKFFAYADKIGRWYDGPETFVICKAKHVQLGAQTYGPPQAVDSSEAAILANAQRYRYLRDIKRRDCLTLTGPDAGVWCDAEDEDRNLMLLTEDDLDQAIDAAMQKERKWDADLSAPAVEGGCDGHKKIRDSATTLDAELASLNAMRYNRTL